MLLTDNEIEDILHFWFPNQKYNKFWFEQNIDFDILIKNKYQDLLLKIFKNIKETDISQFDSNNLIAIIILLDQFSRNINRAILMDTDSNIIGDKTIYYTNIENNDISKMTEEASRLSKYWIQKKYYLTEPINKIVFALMPLRHLNKLHDYIIILDILDKIQDKKNDEIYIKFKNQTVKRKDMLMT
jgi:uncharacterized protein (DUF924 family)